MFRIVAAIATAAALTVSASAFAAPATNWTAAPEGSVETMDTHGVNFDNPSEVRAFYKKLQYAAARVCAGERGEQSCRKEALSSAVAQINQPQLALQHEKATGERSNQLAWNQASH